MQTSLQAISEKAEKGAGYKFRNLYGMLDAANLVDSLRYMNRKAAPGVDGFSVEDYEENLHHHIPDLVERLKAKRYRAKPVKRVYIPKEGGKLRPLGLPSVEDKLVQLTATRILEAIYEADFIKNSYGYRRGKSAHDALDRIQRYATFDKVGYVVEADIRGFFDSMDHGWLMKMLAERVEDRAFLNLIGKWLKAGILETDGKMVNPATGTPQGGIISPILANIYLHYALDLWFEKVVKKDCRGKAFLIRYADDFCCLFQYQSDAARFNRALPGRLGKFGLELAPEKTRLLKFSKFKPEASGAFEFLGFEHRWIRSARGKVYVRRKTSRKKFTRSVRSVKEWIKQNRILRLNQLFPALNRRLRGYYNYYGLIGNSKSLWEFYRRVVSILYKWMNRRSQRRSFDWPTFLKVLENHGLERPRIQNPKRSKAC